MSRLDGRFVVVETDGHGRPTCLRLPTDGSALMVEGWASHWREWVGVLDGEPERDIWTVLTEAGPCELHHLRHPTAQDDEPAGRWVLWRWHD